MESLNVGRINNDVYEMKGVRGESGGVEWKARVKEFVSKRNVSKWLELCRDRGGHGTEDILLATGRWQTACRHIVQHLTHCY